MRMTRSQMFRKVMESFKIRRQDLSLVPFRFNEAQERVWQIVAPKLDKKEKIWLIILKARRLGLSTFCEALMLARCVMENRVHALVMASKGGNTKEIWQMSSTMVEHSPWRTYAYKVRQAIQLGESRLTVQTAGTPDATRGLDLTCLHNSECAFWEDKRTMLAVRQCLPYDVDTFNFLESTANSKTGFGEPFYDEWKRSNDQQEQSDFEPIFLAWHSFKKYQRKGWVYADQWKQGMPQLVLETLSAEEQELRDSLKLTAPQLAWRRWAIPNLCEGSIDKFNQEYPGTAETAFIQAGLPFFRRDELYPFYTQLKKGQRFIVRDQKLIPDPTGYIEIFTEPKTDGQYVIGSDSSFGFDEKSRSRSAAEVVNMETLEQVAEYDACTPPHIQARHLAVLGKYYNNALIAPEVQASGGGGGREIIIYLKALQYWNLHLWRHGDKVKSERPSLYGWETNSRTRPRMVARIREVVMERSCTIHSEKLLNQLGSFGENETGRLEALQGHDDLLFAWGIALMSRSENYIAKLPTDPYLGKMELPLESMGLRIQAYNVSECLQRHFEKVVKGKSSTFAGPKSYLEM